MIPKQLCFTLISPDGTGKQVRHSPTTTVIEYEELISSSSGWGRPAILTNSQGERITRILPGMTVHIQFTDETSVSAPTATPAPSLEDTLSTIQYIIDVPKPTAVSQLGPATAMAPATTHASQTAEDIVSVQLNLTTAKRANAVYAVALAHPRMAYAAATRVIANRVLATANQQGDTPDENATAYLLAIRLLVRRIAISIPVRTDALNHAATEFAAAFEESMPDCNERAAELVARILDVPQLTMDALGREIYVVSALPVALLEHTFKGTPARIGRILGDAITQFVPADKHLQVQANYHRLREIGQVS